MAQMTVWPRRSKMSMQEQIQKSKLHIRRLKKTSPYIFNEYYRLCIAERELEKAKKEYEFAKIAWKNLGR
jgi:hypothetical protein